MNVTAVKLPQTSKSRTLNNLLFNLSIQVTIFLDGQILIIKEGRTKQTSKRAFKQRKREIN